MPRIAAWVLLIVIAVPALVAAQTIESPQLPYSPWFSGARNSGMGLADLATGTDPMAIINNPALQLSGRRFQLAYNESNWIGDWNVNQTGASFEWEGLRVGVARDELKLRYTADPEEGAQALKSVDFRVWSWTTGISARILQPEEGQDGILATSGLNWRSYTEGVGEYRLHNDELDFGLTLGYLKNWSSGWSRFHLSGMVRNMLANDMEGEDDSVYPATHFSQVGGTVVTVLTDSDDDWETVRLTLAYTYRVETDHKGSVVPAAHRWGVEAVVMEILSLRTGNTGEKINQDYSGTLGAGLRVPQRVFDPLIFEVDWARLETNNPNSWEHLIEGRVGIGF